MQKIFTGVALSLAVGASSAFAAVPVPDLGNIYVEGAYGNTEYGVPDQFFNLESGFSHARAIRGLVGIDFKRKDKNRVSFEAFAQRLGSGEAKETYTDADGTFDAKAELKMTAVGAGLRFGKVWEDLSLFGRAGAFKWKVDGSLKYSGENISEDQLPAGSSESENGYDLYLGAGVQWFLMEHLYVGGEWTYYPADLKGEDIRMNVASAMVGIYF